MDNKRTLQDTTKKSNVYKSPAEREREYKKWEQKERDRCFWRKLIDNNGGWGGPKGSP